jgi:hypothetical protein
MDHLHGKLDMLTSTYIVGTSSYPCNMASGVVLRQHAKWLLDYCSGHLHLNSEGPGISRTGICD